MDEESFYEKEIRKIELQRKQLRDQYNTLDNPYQSDDYEKVLHADLEFTPKGGETWSSYCSTVLIYAKMNAKKNIQTHINGPKGAWYTHRNPQGCFACEDTNLISVLCSVLSLMSKQYPNNTF